MVGSAVVIIGLFQVVTLNHGLDSFKRDGTVVQTGFRHAWSFRVKIKLYMGQDQGATR